MSGTAYHGVLTMNNKDRVKLSVCQKHFKPLEATPTGMLTKGCAECNTAPPPRPVNRPTVSSKEYAAQHRAAADAAAQAQSTVDCKNWALGKYCGMGDHCKYRHDPEKAGHCLVYAKRKLCTKKTACKLLPQGHWIDPNQARKRPREDIGDDGGEEGAGASMQP